MVNGLAPAFEFHPSIVRTDSSNSSQSIGRGSAGARCAGSVVIGSAVHVPLILARHKDKSPDFRPILADTFRETQAISRIAINRPIFGKRRSTGGASSPRTSSGSGRARNRKGRVQVPETCRFRDVPFEERCTVATSYAIQSASSCRGPHRHLPPDGLGFASSASASRKKPCDSTSFAQRESFIRSRRL